MNTFMKIVALVLLISIQIVPVLGQETENKSFTTSNQDGPQIEKRRVSNENPPANKRVVLSTINNTNEADTFSFVEYLRNNPEDFSLKYQAYLRIRLSDNGITTQEKLETEVALLKAEIDENKTDYSKIAHKEKEKPSQKEEIKGQMIAGTSGTKTTGE
jgi:hypothetical protein